MTPNLFAYATSELSQDGLFCWLASWADTEHADHTELHEAGRRFVGTLLATCGRRTGSHRWGTSVLSDYKSVKAERQVAHIDVVITIDDEFAILIEDKTGTSDHGDQLDRYKTALAAARPHLRPENVFPVYVRLEEQSDLEGVEKAGYGHFTRADMLDVLNAYDGDNAILLDYREHVLDLDAAISSWRTTPPGEWDYYAWTGFFSELQRRIRRLDEAQQRQECGWDHVPNAQGGFMGFWWGFQDHQEPSPHQVYFQLEDGCLCVKVCVPDDDFRGELRWRWHEHAVQAAAAEGIELVRPARFGRGLHMTVGKLRGDYRDAGFDAAGGLNLESILTLLWGVESAVVSLSIGTQGATWCSGGS